MLYMIYFVLITGYKLKLYLIIVSYIVFILTVCLNVSTFSMWLTIKSLLFETNDQFTVA